MVITLHMTPVWSFYDFYCSNSSNLALFPMDPKESSPLLSLFTILKLQIVGSSLAFVSEFFHGYSRHKSTWYYYRNVISIEAHLLEIFSHFLNTEDKVNCTAYKKTLQQFKVIVLVIVREFLLSWYLDFFNENQ